MAATSTLKNKAMASISRLPGNRIREVIDFVEYLEKKESAEVTGEILADKKLLEGIKKGIGDLKAGRCKSWRSVRKNV